MTTSDTTATFRLTKQDALDASRLVSYHMLNGSYFYLLTVIFTLALCVVAFAEGRIRGVILIGILVLVPLAYVVSWKLIVPSRMRRHYRQTAALHDETCLSWNEDSLTFTSPPRQIPLAGFSWLDRRRTAADPFPERALLQRAAQIGVFVRRAGELPSPAGECGRAEAPLKGRGSGRDCQ